MAVHPSGDGAAWEENIDVNQPHGLDYRAWNHLAIGVRKRNDKEHNGYADATVGGEHLPGGCRVLGIVDSTSDLTSGAGDAAYDITDGMFQGRGVVYDQTSNVLWCFTGDGTVSDNPYPLMWGPESICEGADFTWTGDQQFDGTNAFTDEVDFSEIQSDGTSTFTELVDFSTITPDLIDETFTIEDRFDASSAGFSGDVTITGDVDISGSVNIDGLMTLDTNNTYISPVFWLSQTGLYSKAHNLGTNNLQVIVLCSSYDAGPVCASAWKPIVTHYQRWGVDVQDISTNNLAIQVGANGPRYYYNSSGIHAGDTSCYCKIIATRLST